MSELAERNQAPNSDAPVDWEALVAEMIAHPEPVIPFEETEQGQRELAAAPGFEGTLRDYLDWIEEMLMYGSLQLSEAREIDSPPFAGKLFHELRLVTGGFSTDESLLHRVRQGFLSMFWMSEHRGGLYVYEIPDSMLESDEIYPWMRPVPRDDR